MGAYSGPQLKSGGLILALDCANKRSNFRTRQTSNLLVSPHLWTEGNDSFNGYGRNGDAAEQTRVFVDDDPWGRRSVVWRTTPDAVSGADGGWNTPYYPIDRSKLYRWSVWVRRHTAGTGGTFYFGLNPAPIRNDNGAVQSNPYFAYVSQDSLALNQWYLVVAHCFPEGYSGGRHPDSGWYENGQKIADKSYGNCGTQDVRWNTSTTTVNHRAYHYYTTNVNSGLEFAFPRLDICDGTQPSIGNMISLGESGWNDLGPHQLYTEYDTVPTYNTEHGGSLFFNGTTDGLSVPYSASMDFSEAQTIIMWMKPGTGSTGARRNPYNQAYGGSGTITHETNGGFNYYFGTHGGNSGPYVSVNSVATVISNELAFVAVTRSQSQNICRWYKNGVLTSSGTAGGFAATNNGSSPILIGKGYTSRFIGDLYHVAVYNKFLTDADIREFFNATRAAYGI